MADKFNFEEYDEYPEPTLEDDDDDEFKSLENTLISSIIITNILMIFLIKSLEKVGLKRLLN